MNGPGRRRRGGSAEEAEAVDLVKSHAPDGFAASKALIEAAQKKWVEPTMVARLSKKRESKHDRSFSVQVVTVALRAGTIVAPSFAGLLQSLT